MQEGTSNNKYKQGNGKYNSKEHSSGHCRCNHKYSNSNQDEYSHSKHSTRSEHTTTSSSTTVNNTMASKTKATMCTCSSK